MELFQQGDRAPAPGTLDGISDGCRQPGADLWAGLCLRNLQRIRDLLDLRADGHQSGAGHSRDPLDLQQARSSGDEAGEV